MTDTLTKPYLELEGTWEEILARAEELKGHRVRVVVLPAETQPSENKAQSNGQNHPLPLENQRALDVMRQWRETPLTEEDIAVLDEMEEFTKTHRFTLRRGQAEA